MLLELQSIQNKGDATKEYVHMRATGGCKLNYFILMDSTYKSPAVQSNKLRHVYWWAPEQTAQKGDHVFLFTTIGTNFTKANDDGTTSRFFYWNLKEPVWNDTGDTAVLCQLDTWQTKTVDGK